MEATQRWICFIFILVIFYGLALLAVPIQADAPDAVHVGAFSHAQAGGPFSDSWKPLTFHKIDEHTEYSLVEDDGTVVVKAVSRGSSSGLTREVTLDPKLYPIVEWRWKIENVLQKGDVTTKAGDDYPARLYITFAYDESKIDLLDQAQYELAKLLHGKYPPTGAITYIWESRSPVGTIVPNPYTDRVQMIVLESGADKAGQWVSESRNLYEDYRKAFGDDPPAISGVAVMTDTDNTQESAVAYYGDIVFRKTVRGEGERRR